MNTNLKFNTIDKGLVFFFFYFLFAFFYYQERSLFLDNPFQIFHMIVEDKIEIMAGRWPAVIVRWIPFLAIELGLPLKTVLFLFSFSYALFHFLVYVILRWLIQDKTFSLYYIIWLALISGHAFFWNNSELIQACSVLFIFLALLRKMQLSPIKIGLLLFTGIILLFYHPLIILPILIILSFWFLQNPKRRIEYGAVIISVVVGYIIKSKFFSNWYDAGKQTEFYSNVENIGMDIFNSSSFQNSLSGFLNSWQILLALLIIANIYYFFKVKGYFLAILSIVVVSQYIIVIAFADPAANFHFYNEVNLIPLVAAFIVIHPDFGRKLITNNVLLLGILCVFIIRLNYTSTRYTDRIAYWKQEVTHYSNGQILGESEMDMSQLVMSWASPYESLIISSMYHDTHSYILVHPDPKKMQEKNSLQFNSHFKSYTYSELRNRYFKRINLGE